MPFKDEIQNQLSKKVHFGGDSRKLSLPIEFTYDVRKNQDFLISPLYHKISLEQEKIMLWLSQSLDPLICGSHKWTTP